MIKQNNVIKEYENWINLLINLVNRSKAIEGKKDTHDDYASLIQQQVQRIIKVENENLELKLKLIDETRKTFDIEAKRSEILKMKKMIESDIIYLNENDNLDKRTKYNLLIDENKKLLKNIELITEELDNLYYNNKKYENSIFKEDDIVCKIYEYKQELKFL